MFATGDDQSMKHLGVGLAAAILIDATIVRAVLLPATMKLLGKSNWYPPRALRWLPKVEHEPRWPMTDTSCQPGCPGLEERDLLSPAEAGELARLFKLLANDSRLRMLHALARAGELRVTDSRPRWT